MKQYLDIVKNVLDNGVIKPNRTGIDTISLFGQHFIHDLADGFPLITTKKMDGKLWNSIVEELLWFISGENHIRNFTQKSKIWDAWADQEGNLETAYGFYWRNYPVPRWGADMVTDQMALERFLDTNGDDGLFTKHPHSFDQLGHCVEQLKANPNSRRLVVLAWEPYNAHKSKLPPCHFSYVFNVQDDRLCLHMTQRSVDLGLGFGFNIASYALLTHIIAREVGLKPGILSISLVDAHVYYANEHDETLINGIPRKEYDHVKVLREQLIREPYDLPQLKIEGGPWDNHKFEDFKLIGYRSHGLLKMRVAI